jgi:hypothetical protein
VVWQWHDGHDWEIMLYDLDTRLKRRLTNNSYDDRYPYIDGRMVVFTADVPSAGREIYLYNIATDILTRLTDNLAEDVAPAVQDGWPWSDGLVAWQRWDGHDWEIMYEKIGSGFRGRLTFNSYDDVTPAVGGGWIVWEGLPGADSEIFAANVYESGETVRLTSGDLDDWAPRVEAGKVIWLKGLDPTIETDLYTHDLRFGTGARLTEDNGWDDTPHLNLWRAVWYRMYGHHPHVQMEVMLQSLLGGPAGSLSTTIPHSQAPDLDGPLAAWVFDDGSDYEVAVAQKAFPFLDVNVTHRHRLAIEMLALMGVVVGRTPTSFEPGGLLLRQQYAKMAVLGLGAPVSEADVCPFSDVLVSGPGSLYPDNYIAAAHTHRLVLGKSADHFAPYDNLTRAQAVTIAVRAVRNHASGSLAPIPWSWMGLTAWYRDATHGENVHLAEVNHLLDGINLAHWNPDTFCTRGEAAQIIWNLWQRLAAPGRNVEADAPAVELLGRAIACSGCVAVEFDIIDHLIVGDWAGAVIENPDAGIGLALLRRESGAWGVVDLGTGYTREDWLSLGAPVAVADYLAGW